MPASSARTPSPLARLRGRHALGILAALVLSVTLRADTPQSTMHPSRISPPVYFPQLLPYWKAGPMVENSLYYTEPTEYAPDAAVSFQTAMLREADPILRARAITELARCNNRNARRLLRGIIAAESDPLVRASILSSLLALGTDNAADLAAGNLNHSSHQVRVAAARLYCAQPGADLEPLVKRAGEETHPGTRLVLWRLLAERPGDVALRYWQSLVSEPAPLNSIAAGAIAAHPRAAAGSASALDPYIQADDYAIRQQVAYRLAADWPAETQARIFATLSADSHLAVRLAVADSLVRLHPAGTLPIALRLAQDSDTAVRFSATQALAHYGDIAAFDALVARLNDPDSVRVRRQAEDSLVALQQHVDVIGHLAVTFSADTVETRYHGYRLARRLDARRYGDLLTARIAADAGDARLASTLIETLGQLDYRAGSDAIVAQARNESPDVRAAVALALGRLGRVDQAPLLIAYVQAEMGAEPASVRHAALHAMGLLPSGDFSETLLWVLQQVKAEGNPIDSQARAIAIWATGFLEKPSDALLKRCYVQITKPVIPTPMGPIFEDDAVRVSACFAMVQQALARPGDHDSEANAHRFIAVIGAADPTEASSGAPPPTGPSLRDYAYQAECYLEGREAEPHEPEPSSYSFSFREISSDTY